MPWTLRDMPDQSGRVVVVTGANSGLGYETAKALAAAGATVVMACRRKDAGDEAVDRLRGAVPHADVSLQLLDLASLDSVGAAAQSLAAAHPAVHLLVNNAGVMAIPRRETSDGFEMQLGVNHLGHFALTGRLLERIVAAGPGSRVVNVSSLMHVPGRIDFDDLQGRRYGKWKAYSQSKLANLLFTSELQRRLEEVGAPTISVAAHPGYARTHLQTRGPEMEANHLLVLLTRLANQVVAQSAARGVLPSLRAATDPAVEGDDFCGPAAFVWGGAVRSPRAPQARSVLVARRLWQVSEDLTGVTYDTLK